MPSTVREIAEQCGVTKQTVINNLRSMGLWDYHVTPGDHARPTVVDDEASSAVAQQIMARRAPATRPPAVDTEPERADQTMPRGVTEQYEARIADLKAQIADLQGRLDAASEAQESLTERVGSMAEAMRALPSADDVERARADGEAAGRASGAETERDKVAAMGFWERRRYLKRKQR